MDIAFQRKPILPKKALNNLLKTSTESIYINTIIGSLINIYLRLCYFSFKIIDITIKIFLIEFMFIIT